MRYLLDNSLLEDMVCSRRLVYRAVLGLRKPLEPALRYGKLFHAFMQYIEPDDLAMFMAPPMPLADKWNTPEFIALRDQVPPLVQMQLAVHACTVRDQLAQGELATREGFFKFAHPTVEDVDVCGTLDRREWYEPLGAVLIRDFKTTGKPINSDLLDSYRLKSQLFFYAATQRMMMRGRAPTNKIEEAILAGRIAREYIIVNYKDNSARGVMFTGPELIHTTVLDEYEALIEERAHVLRFIAQNPNKSTRDGMTNGGCFFCPFKSICSANDPDKEAHAAAHWQYGMAPYNPEEF